MEVSDDSRKAQFPSNLEVEVKEDQDLFPFLTSLNKIQEKRLRSLASVLKSLGYNSSRKELSFRLNQKLLDSSVEDPFALPNNVLSSPLLDSFRFATRSKGKLAGDTVEKTSKILRQLGMSYTDSILNFYGLSLDDLFNPNPKHSAFRDLKEEQRETLTSFREYLNLFKTESEPFDGKILREYAALVVELQQVNSEIQKVKKKYSNENFVDFLPLINRETGRLEEVFLRKGEGSSSLQLAMLGWLASRVSGLCLRPEEAAAHSYDPLFYLRDGVVNLVDSIIKSTPDRKPRGRLDRKTAAATAIAVLGLISSGCATPKEETPIVQSETPNLDRSFGKITSKDDDLATTMILTSETGPATFIAETALKKSIEKTLGSYEKLVSFDVMMDDIITEDKIYIGESHQSLADKIIALQIISSLSQKGKNFVIMMEMFASDKDFSALKDYMNYEITDDEFIKRTQLGVWGDPLGGGGYLIIVNLAREKGIRILPGLQEKDARNNKSYDRDRSISHSIVSFSLAHPDTEIVWFGGLLHTQGKDPNRVPPLVREGLEKDDINDVVIAGGGSSFGGLNNPVGDLLDEHGTELILKGIGHSDNKRGIDYLIPVKWKFLTTYVEEEYDWKITIPESIKQSYSATDIEYILTDLIAELYSYNYSHLVKNGVKLNIKIDPTIGRGVISYRETSADGRIHLNIDPSVAGQGKLWFEEEFRKIFE